MSGCGPSELSPNPSESESSHWFPIIGKSSCVSGIRSLSKSLTIRIAKKLFVDDCE